MGETLVGGTNCKSSNKVNDNIKILYTYKHTNIQDNLNYQATHKLTAHIRESYIQCQWPDYDSIKRKKLGHPSGSVG